MTPDQEINAVAGIQLKSFESPDEVRPSKATEGPTCSTSAAGSWGRTTLEAGWKWSRNVKPIAGTDSCQVSHLGYCL